MTAPAYTSLVTDLAQHIANHGLGQWAPTGIYKTYAPPAIYLGRLPDEAGNSIALNVYSDDRSRDDTTPDIRVQIRVRGTRDPRITNQIADDIFALLHDQSNYRLDNATRVLLSRRHLRAPEDTDANGRWHRADSYTFTLNP